MAIPLVAPLTPINLNDAGTMKTSQDHKAVVEATKDGPSSMSLTPNVNSDVQSQDPDIAGASSSKLNGVEFGDEADQYPGDSNSEGEEKVDAETPTLSEKKRTQIALFQA